MRHILASLIVVALVGPAFAQQPPPQQPYQPQPQPHAQPQAQQAAWYRFTLNDGRVIDVQIVGGDATNWHFLQNGQLYSIPKATVVGSISLAALQAPPPPAYAPAPQYAPPPQYAPMPPPPAGESDTHLLARRRAGWAYFGSSYLLTVMIALARHDNDPDALAGLIPVAGPIIWTVANDDDDIFEDGWDWLAATDALIQGAGLVWAFSGPSNSSKRVAVTPTARRGFHGIALGGTW